MGENITMLFVFAVFLISVFTEGYLFGIVSAFVSVFAVNYAFTFPYFAFNFTIPENFMSALIMIANSLMTSTLTTRLKFWQTMKAEGERERMRANLLRAVSHDLRTPLTGICASSTLMLELEELEEEKKRALLLGIREDAEWLTRLVENLLSITRLDGGSVRLHQTPTAVDELIESTVLKFRRRLPEAPLSVTVPEQVVLVPMDALLIEQVLLNLMENAIYHAKGMSVLTLCVVLDGEMATFRVEDNGFGMDVEKISRILDGETDSLEESTDRKSRHAGIGLSVCSTIVRAHGAKMFVELTRDGGACFSFQLKTMEMQNDE